MDWFSQVLQLFKIRQTSTDNTYHETAIETVNQLTNEIVLKTLLNIQA